MKSISHRILGEYLAANYMRDLPCHYRKAFLFGCTQPDKNPSTYLKGSLRAKWFCGHNWENSKRYICRTATYLEQKNGYRLLDFYILGKLIHYTADAFTYVHNNSCQNILQHRCYENKLHKVLQPLLQRPQEPAVVPEQSIADTIQKHHRIYAEQPSGIYTDLRYVIAICRSILYSLLCNTKNEDYCRISTISS